MLVHLQLSLKLPKEEKIKSQKKKKQMSVLTWNVYIRLPTYLLLTVGKIFDINKANGSSSSSSSSFYSFSFTIYLTIDM